MFVKTTLMAGSLMLLSLPAFAHSVFLNCSAKDSSVECVGSFSDGSSAAGFPFEVISYEDQLLLQGNTDQAAYFSFPVPTEDYYILMDAGPGHVVEVDMLDVL